MATRDTPGPVPELQRLRVDILVRATDAAYPWITTRAADDSRVTYLRRNMRSQYHHSRFLESKHLRGAPSWHSGRSFPSLPSSRGGKGARPSCPRSIRDPNPGIVPSELRFGTGDRGPLLGEQRGGWSTPQNPDNPSPSQTWGNRTASQALLPGSSDGSSHSVGHPTLSPTPSSVDVSRS